MKAVLLTGGKQYWVTKGDTIDVELLDFEKGSAVEFTDVLMVEKDDTQVLTGMEITGKCVVKATVLAEGRAKKLIVFKKKRRKKYRNKAGHRQWFTRVKIEEIVLT